MLRLFGAKVRHVRVQHELTQSELARQLGLAQHTHINHIEAGRRAPSLDLALRMADVLGVTTDYLLQDSIPIEPPLAVKSVSREHQTSLRLFGAKLNSLRSRRGLTQIDLTQQLGLASQGYISKLEAGSKEPSPDLVALVAELFGVTTDYLLYDDLPIVEGAESDSASERG